MNVVNGKQMFTALNWLGKSAKCIRCWGEERGIMSPANLKGTYDRTEASLDRMLVETR